MATLRVNASDFALSSQWRCAKEGSAYRIVYGPTTPTKTITFNYALPAGAIINYATVHGILGNPLSGIELVRVNNVSFRTGSADVTAQATATQLVAKFEFQAIGSITTDTQTHSGSLTFTKVYLLIDYTAPDYEWSANVSEVVAGSPVTFSIAATDATTVHKISIRLNYDYQYSAYIDAGEKMHTVMIPIEWANGMPDAMSAVATVMFEALSGDTLEPIGQPKTGTLRIVCPDYELDPGELTLTVNKPMWDMCIQGYSTITATHTGGSSYFGARIGAVQISGGGYSSATRILNTGVLQTAGENTFMAVIIDSRGRMTATTASVYVEEYSPPMIQSTMQTRADNNGEMLSQGTNVRAAVFYTYTTIGNNAVEVDMKYRIYGSTEWTDGCSMALGSGEFAFFGDNQIAENQSYEIQITVRDALTSASIVRTIGPSSAYMVWDAKNNAVGFGCRPSGFNRVQLSSEWELYLGVKTVFDHMHPVGSVCLLASGTTFDEATYGEWIQIGAINIGGVTVNAWQRTR